MVLCGFVAVGDGGASECKFMGFVFVNTELLKLGVTPLFVILPLIKVVCLALDVLY